MPQDLAELAARALAAARAAGAEAADVLVVEDSETGVDVRRGALEEAQRAEGTEVGLRVLMGRRQSCISVSDLSPATLAEAAERAVAMARLAPEDASVGLADPGQLAGHADAAALDMIDDAPEPAPALLEEMARRAEAAAAGRPGIAQIESAGAGHSRRRVHVAATNGLDAGYARSVTSLSCVAITGTGTGMERDYAFDSRTHLADLDSPEAIGALAAERTLARAGPRKPPTGTYPVLYDERVAASLVGHLLMAANGASVARGASWLRERMGARVLPAGIDLVEEPLRPRTSGSRPIDAEGLPTARRPIVEDGTLTRWILDLGAARRLGLESTANAARSTAGPPSPSVTNVALTQGERSAADLMRDMGTGLLVTSMIGSTISGTTGDYSRGASGMWVENGEPAYPVAECTIAGNLAEMLARIVPANDARAHLSRVVPSLLVEGMTVAGD